jgi:mono/diheme cytochrome c family protein
VVVVSGGSFATQPQNFGELALATQLEALAYMEYDAITLGQREMAIGADTLERLIAANRSPLVCSNLFHQGNHLGSNTTIIQRGDVSLGILGLAGLPQGHKEENKLLRQWSIADAEQTATSVIDKLDQQVDLILLLSQLGFWNTLDLVDRFPQIDIAVVGNEGKTVAEPIQYGNALVLMSGNRGQNLGELHLTLDGNGTILSYTGNLIPLEEYIPEDPEVAAMVAEFKYRVEELASLEAAQPVIERSESGKPGRYVGAAACQSCHQWIYTKWQVTPHRAAFQTLHREQQAFNRECVSCHAVGFEKDGFRSIDDTPHLVNVQCESCHGKGSNHVDDPRKPMPNQVSEITCLECHCGKWGDDLDFATAVKSIH